METGQLMNSPVWTIESLSLEERTPAVSISEVRFLV